MIPAACTVGGSMIAVSSGNFRSRGIVSFTSPALVCNFRRWLPARVSCRSGDRSYFPAPAMRPASSSSSWFNVASTVLRTTSSRWPRTFSVSTTIACFNPA